MARRPSGLDALRELQQPPAEKLPPPPLELVARIIERHAILGRGQDYFSLRAVIISSYEPLNLGIGVTKRFSLFLDDFYNDLNIQLMEHILGIIKTTYPDPRDSLALPISNSELLPAPGESQNEWNTRRNEFIEQCYNFSRLLIDTCLESDKTKILDLGRLMNHESDYVRSVGSKNTPREEFLVHPDIFAYAIEKIIEKRPGAVTLCISYEASLNYLDEANPFFEKFRLAMNNITCDLNTSSRMASGIEITTLTIKNIHPIEKAEAAAAAQPSGACAAAACASVFPTPPNPKSAARGSGGLFDIISSNKFDNETGKPITQPHSDTKLAP